MLYSFGKALGHEKLTSTEPLENKPVVVKLGIDPERTVGENTYKARNKVLAFMSPDTDLGETAKKPAAKKPAKKAIELDDDGDDGSAPWD